jgi:hypothetical protein
VDGDESLKKEQDMLKRLLARWRLVADAIDGMDDPQGEYLFALEKRVSRLEGKVERVGKRLGMDAPARREAADADVTVEPST